MSFFRKALSRQVELDTRGADPRLPFGDSTPPPPSASSYLASGIPVTSRTVEGIAAVYGATSTIVDAIISLPMTLRTGPTIRGSSQLPLSPLLERPYSEVSRLDWMRQLVASLVLHGNFFGEIIERDAVGLPLQIRPVSPDAVFLRRDNQTGKPIYRFDGRQVDLYNVCHIRNQPTIGGLLGLSPIQACALTFGNAIARERFAEAFFANGAAPAGVIQVPGYLDRSETRKMMRSWIAAHGGLSKANSPAILTEGAEFKPVTISPLDSQLLEALNFSEQQIVGRIFRVPGHLVNLRAETPGHGGNSIDALEISFVRNTLSGYLCTIAEALTSFQRKGEFVVFDIAERVRASTRDLAAAILDLRSAGVVTGDDVRPWLDLDPLDDGLGEIVYAPQNQTPLNPPPGLEPNETPVGQPGLPPSPTSNGNGNGNGHKSEALARLERMLDAQP